MSNSFWLIRPPNTLFAFGMFFLLLAVVYTYMGRVWSRFHSCWFSRAEAPKRYWLEVGTYYLLGLGFIVFFLCKIHAFSN